MYFRSWFDSQKSKINQRPTEAWVVVFIIIWLIVLGVSCLWIPRLSTDRKYTLATEAFKAVLQTGIAVIVTGMLLPKYNRRQVQKAAVNTFRRTIYDGLVEAYTSIKKSRRLLRANCLRTVVTDSPGHPQLLAIPCNVYEMQLGYINETQLDLEIICRQLEAYKSAFTNIDALMEAVKAMEDYLENLVEEYEMHRRQDLPVREDGYLLVKNFQLLEEFVAMKEDRSDQATPYKTQLLVNFTKALTLIQEERLKI